MIIIQLGVVLFAISIHESAHAWMAYKCGDPTGKNQGRITLNPIPHIDPIGSIVFPLVMAIFGGPVFGWAKPVLVNPYNLRNPRRDHMLISAAGPGSNILLAVLGVIAFLAVKSINIVVPVSLFPVFSYRLYASGIFPTVIVYLMMALALLVLINIFLAVFNLLPIPPLDGSWILEGMLKGEALYQYQKIKPYGFIILIIILYVGVLNVIALPIVSFIESILLG